MAQRRIPAKPKTAKVIEYPQPEPDDPLAPHFVPDLDGYMFATGAAIPEFKINKGAMIFARKVKPKAGDMIALATGDGYCAFARFVRGDGFRVLADFPEGMRRLMVNKIVLVITQIQDRPTA